MKNACWILGLAAVGSFGVASLVAAHVFPGNRNYGGYNNGYCDPGGWGGYVAPNPMPEIAAQAQLAGQQLAVQQNMALQSSIRMRDDDAVAVAAERHAEPKATEPRLVVSVSDAADGRPAGPPGGGARRLRAAVSSSPPIGVRKRRWTSSSGRRCCKIPAFASLRTQIECLIAALRRP